FIALALPFYVLGGLLMLAQVRLAEMRVRTARAGVAMDRARWIWRAVTAGLAFVTLFLVFVIAAIFYGGSFGELIAGINATWDGIITVVSIVIGVLATPIFLLSALFRPGSHSSSTTTGKPVNQPSFGGELSQATVHLAYGVVLIILAVIIMLVVAYRTWRALRMIDDDAFTETRERLAPERGTRVPLAVPEEQLAPPPAGSVRAVYRTLLRRMAKVGLARDPDETPTEYAARLAPHLGSTPTDAPIAALSDLTAGYQDERYGGTAPTPSHFERAQAALRRLLNQARE
ncbi:MAG: DUF4129 domain-containing protein, partial [Ktedonobacterales bacterium]|nr:DUF4129 domain-containing protein [Ktedonobacterales bacterium]